MIPGPIKIIPCLALILAAGVLQGAELLELIPMKGIWKYTESPPTGGLEWTLPTYSVTDWKEGPGPLGAPKTESIGGLIRVTTALNNGEPLKPATRDHHYFRTTFNWTNETQGAMLISSNLVDDGAIFYLNGVEVGRQNMPDKGSGRNVAALRTVEVTRDGMATMELDAKPLVQGENVLAVAVYQHDNFSSDIVFGMHLWARLLTTGPLSFHFQPESLTKDVGETAMFEVKVSGKTPYTFQWQKNGKPIAEANEISLKLARVTFKSAGDYRLVVSNALGTITSDAARLHVEPEGVVTYNQTWKHIPGTEELPDAWKELEFNDANWTAAPGPFGYLDENYGDIQKPIRTKTHRTHLPTHYFRTEFDWPHPANHAALQVTGLFDDGAILYLNGVELLRIGLLAETPHHNSSASRLVRKPVLESFVILGNHLVKGRNLLAVELHQNRHFDIDMAFGMKLVPKRAPDTWLHLSQQPEGSRVAEGSPAEISVSIQGTGADFQWFHENKPIPGAHQPRYHIARARKQHTGSYHVTISNRVSTLTSRAVTLDVLPDTQTPILREADGREDWTVINATFSEPLEPVSASNPKHFEVVDTLGESLPIHSVQFGSSTNVTLKTASRKPNRNYLLKVHSVADVSPQTNKITGPMSVSIRSRWPLLSMDATWRFQPAGPTVDSLWAQPDFADDSWKRGKGIFSGSNGPLELPGPAGTALDAKPMTTYFRTDFDFTPDAEGATLFLRHVLDDGAVFYLNGHEVYRFNIPHGRVLPKTRARSRIHTLFVSEPVALPTTTLRPGRNILAVELHRARYPDMDAAFACELEAHVHSSVSGPLMFTRHPDNMEVTEGGDLVVTANAAGASHWQWLRNGSLIAGATNRTLVVTATALDWDGNQLKVEAGNGEAKVASREVTVKVSPDVAPLNVVHAVATGNRLNIKFNKRLDPSSGAALEHYIIKSGAGDVQQIDSITVEGDQVILTLNQSLQQGTILELGRIRDTTKAGHEIAPGTAYTIGLTSVLMPFDAVWKYNATGKDLSSTWRAPDFDDSSWTSGPGLLGQDDQSLNHPFGTELRAPRDGGPVTVYFRNQFVLPSQPDESRLLLRFYADDGAVFYLNGKELHRTGVALNQSHTNTTTRQVMYMDWEGDFSIPSSLLVPGINVLAAEVHQRSTDNLDVIFGAQITMPETAAVKRK